MICIKKRNFLSKIKAATKAKDANIEKNIPVCFPSNTSNNDNEDPNQERPDNLEMQENSQRLHTASVNFQTDSSKNKSSVTNFVQDQINSSDTEEVIHIVLVIHI
jgi:hypothetical protein